MRISDWSSDVCSSDLGKTMLRATGQVVKFPGFLALYDEGRDDSSDDDDARLLPAMAKGDAPAKTGVEVESHETRSEEHTSELQSLMRISYAVFCLKKKKRKQNTKNK